MTLTDRDRDIVLTLCSKVRIIALDQVANTWWAGSARATENARRRLSQLVEGGLLKSASVMAVPLPELMRPVLVWRPSDAKPDFGAAAWQLQSRWKSSAKSTRMYLATTRATRIFGGSAPGRIKQEFQATHDLGVTEMFLLVRRQRPELVVKWIGEDVLAPYRRGQKLPDAVIAEQPDTRPELVLEFGGAYDKPRLFDFHCDCEQRGLPYEVW